MIIAAVALVVLGPKRMPEFARQIGTMMREVRKAVSSITDSVGDIHTDVRSAIKPDEFWGNKVPGNGELHPAVAQTVKEAEERKELMLPYDQLDGAGLPKHDAETPRSTVNVGSVQGKVAATPHETNGHDAAGAGI